MVWYFQGPRPSGHCIRGSAARRKLPRHAGPLCRWRGGSLRVPQRRGQPGSIQSTGTSLNISGAAGERWMTHTVCTVVKESMGMKSGESLKAKPRCTVGLKSHVYSFFIESFTWALFFFYFFFLLFHRNWTVINWDVVKCEQMPEGESQSAP